MYAVFHLSSAFVKVALDTFFPRILKEYPSVLVTLGLLGTAIANLTLASILSNYTTSTSMTPFGPFSPCLCICLWALNGASQGLGYPAHAKILSSWVATREQTTLWRLWGTVYGFTGILAPILLYYTSSSGTITTAVNSRKSVGMVFQVGGLWLAGGIAAVLSILVGIALLGNDRPEKCGFLPIEKRENRPWEEEEERRNRAPLIHRLLHFPAEHLR